MYMYIILYSIMHSVRDTNHPPNRPSLPPQQLLCAAMIIILRDRRGGGGLYHRAFVLIMRCPYSYWFCPRGCKKQKKKNKKIGGHTKKKKYSNNNKFFMWYYYKKHGNYMYPWDRCHGVFFRIDSVRSLFIGYLL